MQEIFNSILEFIKAPEFLASIPLIGGVLAEIGVGIGLNVKSHKNTRNTINTVNNLRDTVEDKKIQRQMKIVLQENAELKKSLRECMEVITRIKKNGD